MGEQLCLWQDVSGEAAETGLVYGAFQTLFQQKDSPLLKRYQKTLRLTRIERVKYLWAASQVLWEERDLEERQRPTERFPRPGRRHTAREYRAWDYSMPAPPPGFSDAHNELVIPDSQFVDTCHTCRGEGEVTCHTCSGIGDLTCDFCGGSGDVCCGSCGGSGDVYCSSCGGSGVYEYTEYDSDGISTIVHRTSCTDCGGSGSLVCRNCGGSGLLICDTCGGRGTVMCYRCHGSGIVTCDVCSGKKALLFDVALHQNYRTRSERIVLSKLDDLMARFPDFQIFPDAGAKSVLAAREEGALAAPNVQGIISRDELERLVSLGALDDVLERARRGLSNLIRQGVNIFSKDLYYIHFSLSGEDYQGLLDPAEGSLAFDRHPFHDLFRVQMAEIKELHVQRRYREMYTMSQQFLELTSGEARFAEHDDACRQELKTVGWKFFLMEALGSLAGNLVGRLIFLLWRGVRLISSSSLISIVLTVGLSWLARSWWSKLPCDSQSKFCISGLVLGGLLGIPIAMAVVFILHR